MRRLTGLDRLLNEIDQSLRTAHATPPTTGRPYPALQLQESAPLDEQERLQSSRLMRINHAGEVAAQGLYRGQSLTAQLPQIRSQMEHAALEESDHLAWCETRLQQLGARSSLLKPLWYWGSFSVGAVAGLVGDRWSLGFVKETEDQVERHLNQHLTRLPANDLPSMAILQQMKADEIRHAQQAEAAGAQRLPWPIRQVLMPLLSKVMTTTAARF